MKKQLFLIPIIVWGLNATAFAHGSEDFQSRRANSGSFKSDKELLYSLNKKVKQLESKNQDLYKRLRNLEKQLQGVLCAQDSSNCQE